MKPLPLHDMKSGKERPPSKGPAEFWLPARPPPPPRLSRSPGFLPSAHPLLSQPEPAGPPTHAGTETWPAGTSPGLVLSSHPADAVLPTGARVKPVGAWPLHTHARVSLFSIRYRAQDSLRGRGGQGEPGGRGGGGRAQRPESTGNTRRRLRGDDAVRWPTGRHKGAGKLRVATTTDGHGAPGSAVDTGNQPFTCDTGASRTWT